MRLIPSMDNTRTFGIFSYIMFMFIKSWIINVCLIEFIIIMSYKFIVWSCKEREREITYIFYIKTFVLIEN